MDGKENRKKLIILIKKNNQIYLENCIGIFVLRRKRKELKQFPRTSWHAKNMDVYVLSDYVEEDKNKQTIMGWERNKIEKWSLKKLCQWFSGTLSNFVKVNCGHTALFGGLDVQISFNPHSLSSTLPWLTRLLCVINSIKIWRNNRTQNNPSDLAQCYLLQLYPRKKSNYFSS